MKRQCEIEPLSYHLWDHVRDDTCMHGKYQTSIASSSWMTSGEDCMHGWMKESQNNIIDHAWMRAGWHIYYLGIYTKANWCWWCPLSTSKSPFCNLSSPVSKKGWIREIVERVADMHEGDLLTDAPADIRFDLVPDADAASSSFFCLSCSGTVLFVGEVLMCKSTCKTYAHRE